MTEVNSHTTSDPIPGKTFLELKNAIIDVGRIVSVDASQGFAVVGFNQGAPVKLTPSDFILLKEWLRMTSKEGVIMDADGSMKTFNLIDVEAILGGGTPA